jgi:hypothetical protein
MPPDALNKVFGPFFTTKGRIVAPALGSPRFAGSLGSLAAQPGRTVSLAKARRCGFCCRGPAGRWQRKRARSGNVRCGDGGWISLTSGYGRSMTQRLFTIDLPFLRKPYRIDALRQAIDAAAQSAPQWNRLNVRRSV